MNASSTFVLVFLSNISGYEKILCKVLHIASNEVQIALIDSIGTVHLVLDKCLNCNVLSTSKLSFTQLD